MARTAPLLVPVELRLGGSSLRWFRLARGVSEMGLIFGRPLPDELGEGARGKSGKVGARGPLRLRFHLPEDPEPLVVDGIAVARRSGDHEERPEDDGPPLPLAVEFHRLDEAARARIARYVEARLLEA